MSVKRLTRDERTAYHEAGHAVAAFFEGLSVRTATIVADSKRQTLGHVAHYATPSFRPDIYADARTEHRVLAHMLVYLAGPAAERQATGRATGGRQDYARALDLASYIANDEAALALWRWIKIRARDFVRARWPFIEAVAHALLAHRRLSGRQVREIIRATTSPYAHTTRRKP